MRRTVLLKVKSENFSLSRRTMNWNIKRGDQYPARAIGPTRKNVSLQKYIMRPKRGRVVDFKDGDTLNCARGDPPLSAALSGASLTVEIGVLRFGC